MAVGIVISVWVLIILVMSLLVVGLFVGESKPRRRRKHRKGQYENVPGWHERPTDPNEDLKKNPLED